VFSCGGSTEPPRTAAEDRAAEPQVAAASSPSPAPEPATVTFTRTPPAVGRVVVQRMTSSFVALAGARIGNKAYVVEPMVGGIADVREETLAVDGDKPTKVKVTYVALYDEKIKNGNQHRRTSPLSGKTYVVERLKEGPLYITTAQG